MKKNKKNRLAISVGDQKGVGFHIVKEALKNLGWQKNFQFVIWSHKETLKVPHFKTQVFKKVEEAFQTPFSEKHLIQIQSKDSVGDWLLEASNKALEKKVSALITGPVRKSSLKKYNGLGQTDLLKKFTKSSEVFMCFRGSSFNVILLNDHTPFSKTKVSKDKLKNLLDTALKSRSFLAKKLQKKKVAVLGLNPHAGEEGLLGTEEEKILKPILEKHPEAEGPLSPDSAFLQKNWGKYSFFIALYHDQGLIPFKMIHKNRGFAQNLGLPFLRLGVDHGTGENLKKKDISHTSFLLALKEAIRCTRNSLGKG